MRIPMFRQDDKISNTPFIDWYDVSVAFYPLKLCISDVDK